MAGLSRTRANIEAVAERSRPIVNAENVNVPPEVLQPGDVSTVNQFAYSLLSHVFFRKEMSYE